MHVTRQLVSLTELGEASKPYNTLLVFYLTVRDTSLDGKMEPNYSNSCRCTVSELIMV